MRIPHDGYASYYVRVDYDETNGLTFEPHCLDIPFDTLATITWFTENPQMLFTAFRWCNESEHLSQHPLQRGSYMVGAAQTRIAGDDVYWKYQVEADVIIDGKLRQVCSTPCTALADGLPRIHPN